MNDIFAYLDLDTIFETLQIIKNEPGLAPADYLFSLDNFSIDGMDDRIEQLLKDKYLENRSSQGMSLYVTDKGNNAIMQFNNKKNKGVCQYICVNSRIP